MTWNIERRFSRSQIDKAEARLAHQVKVIDHLGPSADPADVERSKHIVAVLESKLVRLHQRHEDLFVTLRKRSASH